MSNVKIFLRPNTENHKAFAEELKKAKASGVNILAYDCEIEPDSMVIRKPVQVLV